MFNLISEVLVRALTQGKAATKQPRKGDLSIERVFIW